MNPEDIAKFLTEDPDVFFEGWEELGIKDPGLKDPISAIMSKATKMAGEMLTDKLTLVMDPEDPGFAQRVVVTACGIIDKLHELINSKIIHYKDEKAIEEFIMGAVESAIWS